MSFYPRRAASFCLSWHANNTYYGIGVEIDLWLHAGFDVVGQRLLRAHLALARERYGEVLVPICLAVSPPVLRQRLEQRGRENALEIAQRLDRAARYKPDNCLTLNNDGSLRQSVDEFSACCAATRARSGSAGINQR